MTAIKADEMTMIEAWLRLCAMAQQRQDNEREAAIRQRNGHITMVPVQIDMDELDLRR